MSKTRYGIVLAVGVAACGGESHPSAPTVPRGNAAVIDAGAPAVAAAPAVKTWQCKLDTSHGSVQSWAYLTVTDSGADFTIAASEDPTKPGDPFDTDKTFRTVVAGDDARKDNDFRVMFDDYKIPAARIDKITVYGYMAGFAGAGMEVITDANGKELARLSWGMKAAMGHPC